MSVHFASHAALLLLSLYLNLEHLHHSSIPVPFTALTSGLLLEQQ